MNFLKRDNLVLSDDEKKKFQKFKSEERSKLLKDLAVEKARKELAPKEERFGQQIIGTAGKAFGLLTGTGTGIQVFCDKCGERGTRRNNKDLSANCKCKKCGGNLKIMK